MARLLQLTTQAIERFVRERPAGPSPLFEADSGGLPDPAAWRGSLLVASDTGTVLRSDGTSWDAVGGGAADGFVIDGGDAAGDFGGAGFLAIDFGGAA